MLVDIICKIFGCKYVEDAFFVRSKLSSGHCERCGKPIEKAIDDAQI